MKGLFVIAILLVQSATSTLWKDEFDDFIVKYKKSYDNQEEYNYRLSVFQESMDRAALSEEANGGTAQFGVTQFSDLTTEEFRAKYLMNPSVFTENRKKNPSSAEESAPSQTEVSCNPDPTNFDWNSCGAVGAVRNQQQCGSCWAFSTAETVESYCILAGGTPNALSVQQMLDCDTTDKACNGGLPSNAYSYIQQAGGLETEQEYPYTAEQGTCQYKQSEAVCTVTSFQAINGETGLYAQTSSAQGGPVSICVDASTWQDYQSGILTNCSSNIDHCVQLTGYQNYNSPQAYWLVRNSWGTTWGERGYIWVAIGQDLCGIGNEASVPTVQVVQGNTTTVVEVKSW